jgi:hypothetical protein
MVPKQTILACLTVSSPTSVRARGTIAGPTSSTARQRKEASADDAVGANDQKHGDGVYGEIVEGGVEWMEEVER